MKTPWIKIVFTVALLLGLLVLAPDTALDPWGALFPKTILKLIFALVVIQVLGIVAAKQFGPTSGAVLYGFLGGLVSSTATTASIAHQSKSLDHFDRKNVTSSEVMSFFAATAAMLLEGLALVILGTPDPHFSLVVIFLGPLIATAILIFRQSRVSLGDVPPREPLQFKITPLLKLTVFIIAIVLSSKAIAGFLGQSGFYLLTFIAALFELHSTLIANLQLHDAGKFTPQVLGNLIALSIFSSYLAKVFIIYTVGGPPLQKPILKSSAVVLMALGSTAIISRFI